MTSDEDEGDWMLKMYSSHHSPWPGVYIHMLNSPEFNCSRVRYLEALWKSISHTPVHCYQVPITINEWRCQTYQNKSYQVPLPKRSALKFWKFFNFNHWKLETAQVLIIYAPGPDYVVVVVISPLSLFAQVWEWFWFEDIMWGTRFQF